MSVTLRILFALVIGLGVGTALPRGAQGDDIVAAVGPFGALWLDALRMTIIPLVLSLLITGVASTADAARGGRLTVRALAWFAGMLVAGVVFAAVMTETLLWIWPVDQAAATALRSAATTSTTGVPPMPDALGAMLHFVPNNIFAALSAGEMLPIVVFGIIFGFAVTRLEPQQRAPLLGIIESIGGVMMTIVRWVLLLAPVGVFALALGIGYRTGLGAAGGVLHYVLLVSSVLILQMLFITYPVAIIAGRTSPAKLFRAFLPAQIVALTTQSSLASLPAMLENARKGLDVSPRVAGVVLPLAVSLFRMTSPAGNLAVVLFVAHVSGIALGWQQIAIGAVIGVIGSLSVVGVASTVTFFVVLVPMSLAMGVPIELLPLLLPLEVLPDIWRTIGNVTADLAVTTAVARGEMNPGPVSGGESDRSGCP